MDVSVPSVSVKGGRWGARSGVNGYVLVFLPFMVRVPSLFGLQSSGHFPNVNCRIGREPRSEFICASLPASSDNVALQHS